MYIGRIGGPTMEGVIATEAPTLLQHGCSKADIREDIEIERQGTQREQKKVIPAKLDQFGAPYIELYLNDGTVLRHELSTHPSLGEFGKPDQSIQVEHKDGAIGVAEQVGLHQWRLKITQLPSPPQAV